MQVSKVKLVEVGPRDGLQNEPIFVPSDTKIELIRLLAQTGLKHIEASSFVSPKAIPQLADGRYVFEHLDKIPGIHYSALVPNIKGLNDALTAGVQEIALFTAASDSFTQRNINCSIEESLHRFETVIEQAKRHALGIRCYISCVIGCPYEGSIKPSKVATLCHQLFDLGVDEISLGDTIGVGTPKQTKDLLNEINKTQNFDKIAMHFHDTYGQAIANIYASLECGVSTFDSSIAGLGGCPYARGATGNVATEDVVYLMNGLGIDTGVDIFKIMAAGEYICQQLNRETQSKVAKALA